MPDERPAVVIADPIDAEAVRVLRAGPCRVIEATAEGALTAALPGAWGLIVRSRTKVTDSVMGQAPNLAVIARAGVGVDNVDMAAATRRKIRVVNAPAAATASVAEMTVGLYVVLARNLYNRISATKAGTWGRSELGTELGGKTFGFVGYGRIARAIVHRLDPFGVETIAYDPFVKSSGDETAMVELDDLLARSDFVSLHAASTPENHHLVNAERLARMKKGAYLVNVARGALVDEGALLQALDGGHLAGAALDVFEREPPTDPRLLSHPKLLATPHLAASTVEGQRRAGGDVVEEILRALRGEPLQYLVNREVGSGR